MNTKGSDWSDAEIEAMKTAWTAGKSAAEISRALTKLSGKKRTRSAVLGKIHRLGENGNKAAKPKLARGKASAPPKTVVRPAVVTRERPPEPAPAFRLAAIRQGPAAAERTAPVPVAESAEVDACGMTLLELGHAQCRMPIGQRGGQEVFCGCACDRGRRGRFESFCPGHKARVINATASARKPARAPDPVRVPGAWISHYGMGRRDHGG